MRDISGYLGMILGAVIGALMRQGATPEDIHRYVDTAIRSTAAAETIYPGDLPDGCSAGETS